MKKILFFVAAAGFVFGACAQKPAAETTAEETQQEAAATSEAAAEPVEKTIKDYIPSKAQLDSVSYLVGINFGSFIKGYNFGDLNMAQVKAGMKDFINSKGNQRDPNFADQFKINPEAMNELFNEYLQNRQIYMGMLNKEKEAKYLEANKKKAGVEVTESGLQYKIIEAGNQELIPGPTDTVKVIYKGTLTDGTVFDETPEGEDPATFVVNRVIPGWVEGLQLIGEGGKIQLTIPSELAYGERGTQGIEPNSTLLFDVELVSVAKAAPVVEEAAE